MEGIIGMVVLFIISAVINGNKKKRQDHNSMPPFNNKPAKQTFDFPKQSEVRKSLEDFASEVFQQLNDKTQDKPTNSRNSKAEASRENKVLVEPVEVQRSLSNTRPAFDANRSAMSRTTKPSKAPATDSIKQNEIGNIVPKTRKALVHAIITTEILGPPKAKQRLR